MADNIKQLSEARQKKGWSKEEAEEFAKRRSKELREISEKNKEPDYLASGTQKSIKEICSDEEKDD